MECLKRSETHTVMTSWSCFHDILTFFMKCHENVTIMSCQHDVQTLLGIPLKPCTNFAFKTGFVFEKAFLNNEIWAINIFCQHIWWNLQSMKGKTTCWEKWKVPCKEKWLDTNYFKYQNVPFICIFCHHLKVHRLYFCWVKGIYFSIIHPWSYCSYPWRWAI